MSERWAIRMCASFYGMLASCTLSSSREHRECNVCGTLAGSTGHVAAYVEEDAVDALHRARGGELGPDASRASVAAREVEPSKRRVHGWPVLSDLIGRLRGRDGRAELLADPLFDELDGEAIDEERVLVEPRHHTTQSAHHRLFPFVRWMLELHVARRRDGARRQELAARRRERLVEVRRDGAVERNDRRDAPARERAEHDAQILI